MKNKSKIFSLLMAVVFIGTAFFTQFHLGYAYTSSSIFNNEGIDSGGGGIVGNDSGGNTVIDTFSVCTILTSNLSINSLDRSTNGQVSKLQRFLRSSGINPTLPATGVYGQLTRTAVMQFQRANNISPTGVVATITRAKIASLSCNGANTSPPSTTASITIISPNGGETLRVGTSYTFKWSGSNIPAGAALVFSLINGPTVGQLRTVNPIPSSGEFIITIPTNIFDGDVGTRLQGGTYKIRLDLYDKAPCLGRCAPEAVAARKLASDESNGSITIVTNTVSNKPNINSISPSSGNVGALINIYGTGFTATNNSVKFGNYVVALANEIVPAGGNSEGETRIQITVPDSFSSCPATNPPCEAPTLQAQAGDYSVSVTNSSGTSNSVNFTINSNENITPIGPSSTTVLTPNGGESWRMGETHNIRWQVSNLPVGAVNVLGLTGGPTPGEIYRSGALERSLSNATGSINYTVGPNILQGNTSVSLQPGQYKLKVIVYDKRSCSPVGCAFGENQPVILASDSSDTTFTVLSLNFQASNILDSLNSILSSIDSSTSQTASLNQSLNLLLNNLSAVVER